MISSGADERRLDELKSRIRRTHAVSADLLTETAAALGIRNDTRSAGLIDRLIRSAAWTDAALAVLQTALPRWKPRRLTCEDGVWRCALSTHWSVPDWLDDSIESDHALLPLAILSASIEARQYQSSAPQAMRTVPRCVALDGQAAEIMCCDNFA